MPAWDYSAKLSMISNDNWKDFSSDKVGWKLVTSASDWKLADEVSELSTKAEVGELFFN